MMSAQKYYSGLMCLYAECKVRVANNYLQDKAYVCVTRGD